MHSVGPANLSHTLAHSLSAPIVKVEYKIASSPPTGIHVFRKQRRFSRIWTVCPEQERMQFSLRFGVAVDIARPAGQCQQTNSVNPLPDSPRGDPSTKEVENMKRSVSLGRLA